ncbi:MAG: VacJ family lipoprotein [Gammaproteobacteria bacterium]|nr:VacJ family lipoprotein [Gammaproteobacteria bacterium]
MDLAPRTVTARATTISLALLLLLTLSSCAGLSRSVDQSGTEDESGAQHDPWERYNRAMFRFNDKLDRAVVKPVAAGYTRIVPTFMRRGVNNFFSNLLEPTTVINAVLQGKIKRAAASTGRFLTNTTIGFLGLLDVAKHLGLEKHREDFGQTLAVWGFPQGPYLILPFLGPSTARDGIGLIPFYLYTDLRTQLNTTESLIAVTINVIDTRGGLLGSDRLLQLQLDPYVFLRESYVQQRNSLIYDGSPPLEDYDDEAFEND